ncbi:hypothetical protein GCM10028792_28080 [Salinisphaera aquimarina]
MIPVLVALCLTSMTAWAQPLDVTPAEASEPAQPMADLVVVLKSDRVLYLYSDGMVIGQYPIALGKNPVGTKQQRGDNKTPIGAYTLDWRNPQSIFHRSIHVSYPDADDIAAAQARGQDPGDMIMIHGEPDYDDRQRRGDWTNGCIAVSNAAIDEIWSHVADGTRIHIYP